MEKTMRMGLTEDEKVTRFFKKFSDSTNVYIASYNHYGKPINDFDVTPEEKAVFDKYFDDALRQDIFARLTLDSIEDQIVESTASSHIKVAASALKFEGQVREVWYYLGVIKDSEDEIIDHELSVCRKMTTFSQFLKTIDTMREIGLYRMSAELSLAQYEEQSRKSLFSVQEMGESLRRVEALTEILKYLDSDKSLESIMEEFLQVTAKYLGVGEACILKTKSNDEDTMDVLAGYTVQGKVSSFDRTTNIPRISYLEGRKPIILSSGATALNGVRSVLPTISVKAMVALPVTIGANTNLYATYFENLTERSWKIEELQFLSDASRVLQNILEKRIQKNSLASSYASLEQILEHVGCAIIVNDVARRATLFQNKIMKTLFPADKIPAELNSIIWDDANADRDILEYYDYDTGTWYEIHHSSINWVDGRPGALYAIYDVTDKKNYQNQIEHQAFTDFLTGLFNRMCCEKDLAKFIDEAKNHGETGALCYIDLDDFKHINDGLGHQWGDVLLKSISAAFKSVRGIEDTCYRMGGDEFVLIIPPSSYKYYDEIVNNIKAIFTRPWYLKETDYYSTMSMGIVTFPDDGESVEDLIKKADIAMYEAKKSGKNRVARYNVDSSGESNKRLDMEKNMRDATNGGCEEFLVYYQPIIDIQLPGTPCTGAEALVRWNSNELGFISPGDFIPLAEYLGLINPIGDYVLKEACRELKKWNDNGHPNYKVNVNLSVVQLMQTNIVDIVKTTIEETGINPHNLTLEVTESLAINDMERMKKLLSEIRSLGVRIALDDFGTGYSSLNHIREIPLDVIKVDQCFVRELVEDDYSKSFIRMVGELAGAIGVSICVEGIETEEQYKVLEGMKVRLIQGYYFDKPMTREEFEAKYV